MAENSPPSSPHVLRTATRIVARGAVQEAAAILQRTGARRILVVRDVAAWQVLGGDQLLAPALAGRSPVMFDVATALPSSEVIDRAAAVMRTAAIDAVLAVGGGTTLDIAKAAVPTAAGREGVGALLAEGRDLAAAGARRVPLIAVPTTAGTGAEATATAVVYVAGVKHSLEGEAVRPSFALVDAALCDRLPASITATTGLDCLCQAAESLWAVGSNEPSRAAAQQSLVLAVAHLERAVVAPDAESRDAMSLAAHLAGVAIDTSRTTAPHALSYVLSARHGVAHGHAVALFFGEALAMIGEIGAADCVDARGVDFVRARVGEVVQALGAIDAESARMRFDRIIATCGLATRLVDVGAGPEDCAALVDGVNARRLSNHPQRLQRRELEQMVQRLLAAS